MNELTGKQRKYLRGLAHDLKPIVYVGQQGLSEAVLKEAGRALGDHELVKVKFVDYKKEKKELSEKIAAATGGILLGTVGNLSYFYLQQPDPEKRKIKIPD